jgi:hypothetical protein
MKKDPFVGVPSLFIEPNFVFERPEISRAEKLFSKITVLAKVLLLHNTRHGKNEPASLLNLMQFTQVM